MLWPWPLKLTHRAEFSFFAGVETRNIFPAYPRRSSALVHKSVPGYYMITGTCVLWIKISSGCDFIASTPFPSLTRVCETFNPPVFEFKLSESLKGGPSIVSKWAKEMGSQNKCTCSKILTILTLLGHCSDRAEIVNNLSPQGIPQWECTLDQEEGQRGDDIAHAARLQRFEWEAHVLLQLIASRCVPCWTDASAEFCKKIPFPSLFCLGSFFSALIPGYSAKSGSCRIGRAASSS